MTAPPAVAERPVFLARELHPRAGRRSWLAPFLGECIGTFVLVLLGLGAVHASLFGGASLGQSGIALVWGAGVVLGILISASLSGAHLNPAITAALALCARFPLRRVPLYWAAQLFGAFLAAALLHALFADSIAAFEAAHGLVRGAAGSELSASAYGEYFPNPSAIASARVSWLSAMLAEGVATAALAFVVLTVDAKRVPGGPWVIGLTVAVLICVVAPLTQACFNPARDLGPRLFAWLAGWGSVAIPGPRGGFLTVYVLAPLAGALLGAGLQRMLPGRAGAA